MTSETDQSVQKLAELLGAATRGVAFTGAGISTESGIADFRSPGGVWSRHKPVMFQDFLRDPAERRRYWQIRRESIPSFMAATPNAGHRVLARLEEDGRLAAVITQNIDELHQRAGSRRVVEVHGTAMKVACLSCDRRYTGEDIQVRLEAGEDEPACGDCGGILKSMTVSFGQDLPQDVWAEAVELTRACDVFLVMGSSLVVQPAAGLPEMAAAGGARVAIVNREATPLDDLADVVIHGGIGETMERVMAHLDSGAGC